MTKASETVLGDVKVMPSVSVRKNQKLLVADFKTIRIIKIAARKHQRQKYLNYKTGKVKKKSKII